MRLLKNLNRLKAIKPIGALNAAMLKRLDFIRRLGGGGFKPSRGLKPTAGLPLKLADMANKYSKMKVQGEI